MSTFVEQTKNTATFANVTKNSSSFSEQSKNISSFTGSGNSDMANLWASSVFPWLLSLPWQYDTSVVDRVFTGGTKNTSSFTNQTKN